MKRIIKLGLPVILAMVLCACGGPRREEGLIAAATSLEPDEILLRVDGRDVPAWSYLYWLTEACDRLSRDGEVDWSAEIRPGQTYGDYARQQALLNTALYAVVETWAEEQEVVLSEEDRTALEQEWKTAVEAAGSEEVYLRHLAKQGLERCDAEVLGETAYLYRALSRLYQTQGSAFSPAPEEVDAYAREHGYQTVHWIRISGAENPESRQRAEEVFAALNESEDPVADFDALAAAYSDDPDRATYPAGRTLQAGAGVLPVAAEAAAEALEDGQWSGIVEAEDCLYLLLRTPADRTVVAADLLDERLQAAAESAQIEPKRAWKRLDTAEFYEKVLAWRQALSEEELS